MKYNFLSRFLSLLLWLGGAQNFLHAMKTDAPKAPEKTGLQVLQEYITVHNESVKKVVASVALTETMLDLLATEQSKPDLDKKKTLTVKWAKRIEEGSEVDKQIAVVALLGYDGDCKRLYYDVLAWAQAKTSNAQEKAMLKRLYYDRDLVNTPWYVTLGIPVMEVIAEYYVRFYHLERTDDEELVKRLTFPRWILIAIQSVPLGYSVYRAARKPKPDILVAEKKFGDLMVGDRKLADLLNNDNDWQVFYARVLESMFGCSTLQRIVAKDNVKSISLYYASAGALLSVFGGMRGIAYCGLPRVFIMLCLVLWMGREK